MTGIWSKDRCLHDCIYYLTRALNDKKIQKRFTLQEVADLTRTIQTMVRTERMLAL